MRLQEVVGARYRACKQQSVSMLRENPGMSARRFAFGVNPSSTFKGDVSMPITAEEREQVASELKRFAHDLNLNDQQRKAPDCSCKSTKKRLLNILKTNPGTTRADVSPR